MRVDHYGIVVRNISRHIEQYLLPFFPADSLGPVIHDPLQKVNVCFLQLSGGTLELIEPCHDDSPVSAILKRRPAGHHHVCLIVQHLDHVLEDCERAGMVIVSAPMPAVAFGGRRIAFVISRDSLLWELLEEERHA